MKFILYFTLLATITLIASCTVMTVTSAAVGTAANLTGAAVKTTGSAVGAIIPDGKGEEKEGKK